MLDKCIKDDIETIMGNFMESATALGAELALKGIKGEKLTECEDEFIDSLAALTIFKILSAIDEDNECKWCNKEFEPSELEQTKIGKLCDRCARAIRSRGEDI